MELSHRVFLVITLVCFHQHPTLGWMAPLQDILDLNLSSSPPEEKWTGTYFPHSTTSPQPPPISHGEVDHRVPMGVRNSECDDAKINITVDWDGGPFEYTCYDAARYEPLKIPPILTLENIPLKYQAPHRCMNETIEYDGIPTFGPHRPLWPRYGEYIYVPPQRWLHNLEHGAIVALYHPCADREQIHVLKHLVKNCLYRYIVTPSKLVESTRPFALVSWGAKLTMSTVNSRVVENFIQAHALRGPEQKPEDGQYDFKLKNPTNIVSDQLDSELCPNLKHSE